ncbi:MAG: FISUMP domain-containing protein [Patescibacteria group bacterium]|nr:FISUMP domain-containing protein [Patescibacteria group bacterium]
MGRIKKTFLRYSNTGRQNSPSTSILNFGSRGFTLLELIVVIAIVAFLAAAVFILVNPAKRIGQAQDAQRLRDIQALVRALDLYTADNGVLPASFDGYIQAGQKVVLCSEPDELSCDGQIYDCLVVDDNDFLGIYLTQLPIDPGKESPTDTGYYISKKVGDIVSFGACDTYETSAEIEMAGVSKLAPFVCGAHQLVDIRDSRKYNTVKIGTQCWMAQHLNIGTMIAGADTQTDNGIIEKYCYSDNTTNCNTDGGLYQWAEAMQYGSSCNGTGESQPACASPAQGICPEGWHIPSHYELTALERAVCTSGTCVTDFPYDTTTLNSWRGSNEGTKLKVGGTSGMEMVLAGSRHHTDTTFSGRTSFGNIWSSLESSTNAWIRVVRSSDGLIYRNPNNKLTGFSVRCVKD